MKPYFFCTVILLLMLSAIAGNAQVKIGDNPATIGTSSLLEMESTTKGIVFPRMTGAQMVAITTPVTGMFVFNTDSLCICHYNGTVWRSLCGANIGAPFMDWHIIGNSGTTASAAAIGSTVNNNFVGTTDTRDFVMATNNLERMRIASGGSVGIGITTPYTNLNVRRSAAAAPATSGTTSTAILRLDAQNNALDIGAYSASPWGNWLQATAVADLSTKLPLALNPNGGYIGIGTAAPTNHLEIVNNAGSSGADDDLAIKSYGSTLNPQLFFQTAAGTLASPTNISNGTDLGSISWWGQVNSTGTLLNKISSTLTGTGTDGKSDFRFTTSGAEHMRLDSIGRMMLACNTTAFAPKTSLHMYGDGTSGYALGGTTSVANPSEGPEIAFGRGGFTTNPGAAIQFIDYDSYSGGLAFLVHKGSQNNAGGTFADNWPTDVIQAMTIVNNGQIGIGTSDPLTTLQVVGGITITPPTATSLTADNQAITVGNNSTLNITSNTGTASNRTFTLSAGLANGQILYIIYTAASNAAELADSGNCRLSGAMTFDADNTITLMWNGSNWIELDRSLN